MHVTILPAFTGLEWLALARFLAGAALSAPQAATSRARKIKGN